MFMMLFNFLSEAVVCCDLPNLFWFCSTNSRILFLSSLLSEFIPHYSSCKESGGPITKGGGDQTEDLCYRADAAGHRPINLRAVSTVLIIETFLIRVLATL